MTKNIRLNDVGMTHKCSYPKPHSYLCMFIHVAVPTAMIVADKKNISNFYVVGINYKKTDASIRGLFAVSPTQYAQILLQAPQFGVSELFILSTCNRTEVYGFAQSAQQLIDILCSHTTGEATTFSQLSYQKNSLDAVNHLFHVAAGLDSQLLGDYEIVGQLKQAATFAKKEGRLGSFTERLVNNVIQSAKAIRHQTQLSSGTVSVSFAAIQCIRESVIDYTDKKVVLIGTGKIGRNTCKNLVDYLGIKNITVINRTEERAAELANELQITYASIEESNDYISKADIIITSTAADKPIINKDLLRDAVCELIIDLSVPYNVDSNVRELKHIRLIQVDELSKINDETLLMRRQEVPKALAIIEEHVSDFIQWNEMRAHVPVLVAIKQTLQQIDIPELTNAEDKIQKVINTTAVKLKSDNQRGCYYIEAINEYITR